MMRMPRPGTLFRFTRLLFILAFIGGLAAACNPAMLHLMKSLHGPAFEDGPATRAERAEARATERRAALVEHLIESPQGFSATYTRARGRCVTPSFTSDLEVRARPNGQIRLYQVFAPGSEQFSIQRDVGSGDGKGYGGGKSGHGGYAKRGLDGVDGEEPDGRRGRVTVYTDNDDRYDELYAILPRRDIGIVTNGQDGSFRLLRQPGSLEALDPNWLADLIERAHSTGEVGPELGSVLGAPSRACTMLLTLTPDEDNVPFSPPERRRENRTLGLLGRLAEEVRRGPSTGTTPGDTDTDIGTTPGDTDTDTGTTPGDTDADTGGPVADFMSSLSITRPFVAPSVADAIDAAVAAQDPGTVQWIVMDDPDDGDSAELQAVFGTPGAVTVLTDFDPLSTDSYSGAVVLTAQGVGEEPETYIAQQHDGEIMVGQQVGGVIEDRPGIVRPFSGGLAVEFDTWDNGADAITAQTFHQQTSDLPGPDLDFVVAVPPDSQLRSTDPAPFETGPGCTSSATTMCLWDGAFQVGATALDEEGQSEMATVFPGDDGISGALLFDTRGTEVQLEIFNGCGLSDNPWVFASTNNDAPIDLVITYTGTGDTNVFSVSGAENQFFTDTFAICPTDP